MQTKINIKEEKESIRKKYQVWIRQIESKNVILNLSLVGNVNFPNHLIKRQMLNRKTNKTQLRVVYKKSTEI